MADTAGTSDAFSPLTGLLSAAARLGVPVGAAAPAGPSAAGERAVSAPLLIQPVAGENLFLGLYSTSPKGVFREQRRMAQAGACGAPVRVPLVADAANAAFPERLPMWT